MAARGRGRGRGAARGAPACGWVEEPAVADSPQTYLDRLTCIYGTSDSGKTIFLRALIDKLRMVPEGTFFTGTEDSFP